MLKIEKMQISGFKSFSDTTEVVFPEGITAVVGPNGCGKSNIGDAINWVLGEQSAKMLRGSSMQDVIFNGSEGRKAQGMAEVSLHLAGKTNGEGEKPRIAITRRLFRSGESDYLLNGAKTRLRDIQDLLRDERVGAQTYATIEQGRIDQILNAKPKERRLIIEEAAGVAGFKHKRRLAELKLEATHANLLRVNDIVVEVARQINALKRQAAKARRYGRLREELRAKESVRFAAKARRVETLLAEAREAESAVRDQEAAAAARLGSLEAEVVAFRAALDESERTARTEAEALHRLEIEIDRNEARVASCRERIAQAEETARQLADERAALAARREATSADAAAHADALSAEEAALAAAEARLTACREAVSNAQAARDARRARVETLRRTLFESMNALAAHRNRRQALADEAARLAAQRGRLTRERDAAAADHVVRVADAATHGERSASAKRSVEELRASVALGEAELQSLRVRQTETQAAFAAARERETAAAAALRTLEDVATRFAGESDGVRLLLTAGASAGVRTGGVVADFVEASRDVESAAEAYLQGLLPAVVVEDDGDASRAAGLIRAQSAGRTIVLCKTQPSGALAVGVPSNGHVPIPESMRDDPRVIGRLKDRLRLRQGDGFVSSRIGDAVLVDSLDSALALHRDYPGVDYIAPTGDVVYASGVIAAGGRASGDRGLLAHHRKTGEARTALAEAAAESAAAQAALEAVHVATAQAETGLAGARRALEDEGRRGAELELQARRTDDERERLARQLDVLARELDVAGADDERLAGDRAAHDLTAAEAEASHAAVEREVDLEATGLDGDDAALRRALDDEAAARAEAASRAERLEGARREALRFAEVLAEIAARDTAAERESAETAERARDASATRAATETELAVQIEARSQKTREAAAREDRLAEERERLSAADGSLRTVRAELEGVRERGREAEMRRARLEADRGYLDDLCRQELGIAAGEAAALVGEEALAAADEETLAAEIAEIKAKVDAIGPVNLMAIEEFQALEERHATLSTQQKDLEESMASLRESIKRINRNSRDRFLEAFETIRAHYVEIFKVLFGGGRADLVLEEGEDVLECGIEMIVQPPGKRLGHVSLMSGGEKSMAALALLFAIFRYQPSPFCLLDEVDAALDDLNVGRFTRMLGEYAHNTQFILITHNKRSMESANLLYGVTMEEPGVSKLVSLRL
ncbi:MAG TPA: chromosome segregation protein SMC [Candidatus Polarisedimenticolaceae bacterium]|nr:chromosome segregation protein SMC [Candidatus Polarisedimenticolaceae bacterium]